MKKSWLFFLLIPLISLSAAFPIYEDEAQEMGAEAIADESESSKSGELTLGERAEQHALKAQANSSQQKTPSARLKNYRSSIEKSTPVRSKIKDVRENSNRPRVTHRDQKDSRVENTQVQDPKAQQSQAVAEDESGQLKRDSKEKEERKKAYQRALRRAERRSKANSIRSGKRPLGE